jgi:hypothetical protein
MNKELMSIKEEKKIVSIYYDRQDTSKYTVGYIVSLSEDDIILNLIGQDGLNDGYMFLKIVDIFQIDTSGLYEAKIAKLVELNKTKLENVNFGIDNLLMEFFKYAMDNRLIITFQLCDSGETDITGFILEIADNVVKIKKVDNYGNDDGESVILLEDITLLICNSNRECSLKLVFNASNL